MAVPVSEAELRSWGECLINPSAKLSERARCLWGLRHAKEPLALELIAQFVCDYVRPSPVANDLLQHEGAYCLGQRHDPKAVVYLINALENEKQCALVRHESAEALAALYGFPGVNNEIIEQELRKYVDSPVTEVADTCKVGLNRIARIKNKQDHSNPDSNLALQFFPDTVDPSPSILSPSKYSDEELGRMMMDPDNDLAMRYEALFTLRDRVLKAFVQNSSPDKAANLLSEGLFAPGSALLRHEVAFVLGQLSVPSTVPNLAKCIRTTSEHQMVRHEAAEALGSVLGELEGKFMIGTNKMDVPSDLENQAREVLKEFVNDNAPVVRESCVLALDVADYVSSSDQFQYAAVPAQ